MYIEFIYKLSKDNLVSDALNRKEFMKEKLYDTMILKTIVYCDDFLFIKGIKRDYKQDNDVFKIKKYLFKSRLQKN